MSRVLQRSEISLRETPSRIAQFLAKQLIHSYQPTLIRVTNTSPARLSYCAQQMVSTETRQIRDRSRCPPAAALGAHEPRCPVRPRHNVTPTHFFRPHAASVAVTPCPRVRRVGALRRPNLDVSCHYYSRNTHQDTSDAVPQRWRHLGGRGSTPTSTGHRCSVSPWSQRGNPLRWSLPGGAPKSRREENMIQRLSRRGSVLFSAVLVGAGVPQGRRVGAVDRNGPAPAVSQRQHPPDMS